MDMNYFCHLFVLITIIAKAHRGNSGTIAFARGGDDKDQSKCFNNLLSHLPDQSFSASSVWGNRSEFRAHKARMSTMIDSSSNQHGNAWCPSSFVSLHPTEWLQIDLGDLRFIRSFFTMGRGDGNFKEFVPLFYLQYQREPNQWIHYKNEQNKQLIIGNGDSRNVARTQFTPLIVARRIRIYPINKGNQMRSCMRIGIYGCSFDDGVDEYSIPEGHLYSINGNEKFDFRDLSYDGRQYEDKSSRERNLFGGLGQLMDNMIYYGTIHDEGYQNISGHHFVGWNRRKLQSNYVEIILKFDQIRRIKKIKLYALNMVPINISVFARATIHFSIGGKIYDQISSAFNHSTIADRRFYYSRWIVINIGGVLTRFLKINLTFDLDWIVLSEIIIISERSDIEMVVEKYSLDANFPDRLKNLSTDQQDFFIFTKSPMKKEKSKDPNQGQEASFITQSKFGLIVTLTSCIFGFLLLMTLIIFGVIHLRRYNAQTMAKSYYPKFYNRRKSSQVIKDGFVVPLTRGAYCSPPTGGFNQRYQENSDLGLIYPIMGKEYMTLSSKSGTDYDMAGGNSLDGLLPFARDPRYASQNSYYSQNTSHDYPYSRRSIEDSIGSSYTEYATTSLNHFHNILEYRAHKLGSTPSSSQIFYNQIPTTPITETFVSNHSSRQYSPYRLSPYKQSYDSMPDPSHIFNMPTSHNLTGSPYSQYHPPVSSLRNFNTLPSLQGVCGNSVMIYEDNRRNIAASTTLKNVLFNLEEISPKDLKRLSNIGRGEGGIIEFTGVKKGEDKIENNCVPMKSYLSKSLNTCVLDDVRNDVAREMAILQTIKHPSFFPLSSYTLDSRESTPTKKLTLSFLFKVEEQMENLYTFLQKHSRNNVYALSLIKGSSIHSMSGVDIPPISNPNIQPIYPSVQSLISMCYEISEGMRYLEANGIVHRDLAARNCLVSPRLTVKITDIAMSMEIFKEHYSECTTMEMKSDERCLAGSSLYIVKQNYSLQWMALETILKGSYTTKTDVWSFGVTMWEILHRCQRPPFGQFGIKIDRIIENAHQMNLGSQFATLPCGYLNVENLNLSENLFPIRDRSLGITKEFSDLIKQCWNKNSFQRPTFENINLIIKEELSIPDI